ncbi:cob(I)yrinic acid a,c-diamide adenosyltransferase [Sulfuriroseicoccus oceanibius]|uniref:Corrinoid adenosyltransferase n=1 Tax=Sulfuriroseicoccus oceanibius TaxID=2707525 RepID=A0A6B3LDK3_9BACT|nr:cob(I)yrinic acid a,c-diamide adenosyltransferase [Sulfuriroseicoccus oceanibius]QQL45307.1 cob(I)yrinic acid a,c-diamide adenosyltransferase [Sulfuriroseicoccus oceanibius]
MSIATKRGDDGFTDLMFGRRIPKTDIRVAAYGAVDELNGALGPARIHAQQEDLIELAEHIHAIQRMLVTVMGELATDPKDLEKFKKAGHKLVDNEMIGDLDSLVDMIEKEKELTFKGWVMPGEKGSLAGAHLDHARTVCRRAERDVIDLAEAEAASDFNHEVVRFLNRLSDVLWLFARWAEVTE